MVKQHIEYSYEVKGRQDVDRPEDINAAKLAIKKAHPNARITVVHELDESEGEYFLKATAPPGSVQREDLKDRFNVDLEG